MITVFLSPIADSFWPKRSISCSAARLASQSIVFEASFEFALSKPEEFTDLITK